MEQLAKTGLDDTLVMISSDHGESFADEHQFKNHIASTMGHEINVPMIWIHPEMQGWTPPGNQWRSAMDLMPSLLDCYGIESRIPIGSHSVFTPYPPSEIIFSNLYFPRSGLRQELAAIDPDTHWKLILRDEIAPATMPPIFNRRDPRGFREQLQAVIYDKPFIIEDTPQAELMEQWNRRIEHRYYARPLDELAADPLWSILLFDLDRDPLEQTNLWPERRDIAADLQLRLDNWIQAQLSQRDTVDQLAPPLIPAPGLTPEEEKIIHEGVRALGYI